MVVTQFQQNVNQARLNLEKARQQSLSAERELSRLTTALRIRSQTDRSFVGTKRRQSSLLQNVNQALKNRNRAKLTRRSAQVTLRQFEEEQRISLGKLTKRQIARDKARRRIKTITVSIGGARNTIETKQVTVAGKTKTTFINRETGGTVTVNRASTFFELSQSAKKTLTRETKPRPIKEDKVTKIRTRLIRMKTIAELIPGIRLKGKKLSSQEFSKRDLDIISQAKDPVKAVKAIRELKKKEEIAQRQKLQSFLKVTLKEVKTQKDVDNINRAIDKEIKRREDKGLQKDLAVAQVGKEFKGIINDFKKGKLSLKGIKNFGVNVVLGFIGIFTAPIKASFNYGKNLVNRGLWSRKNNPLLRDVKRAALVSANGIVNIVKAANYVRKNPTESQILVGVAGALLGVSLLKAFRKNPGKTLGESLAILFPSIVIKGVGVTAKVTKVVTVKTIKATNKAAKAFNKKLKTALKNNIKVTAKIEKSFHITALVDNTKFPPALKQIYRQSLQNKSVKQLRVLTRSTREALAAQKLITPTPTTITSVRITRSVAQRKLARKKVRAIELSRQRKIKRKLLKVQLIDAKNKAALFFNRLVNKAIKNKDRIIEKAFHITALVEVTKFPPALKQIYRQALQRKTLKELRVLTRSTRQALAAQKKIRILSPKDIKLVKISPPRPGTKARKAFSKEMMKQLELRKTGVIKTFLNQFPKDISKGKVINVGKATRNALFRNKKAQLRVRQVMINKGDELLRESRQINKIITIKRTDIIKATIRLKIGRQFLRVENLLKKAIAWEKANGVLKSLNVTVTSGQKTALRSLILQMTASKLLLRKDLVIVNKILQIKQTAFKGKLAQELSKQQESIVINIQKLKTSQDLKVIQGTLTSFVSDVLQKFKIPEPTRLIQKQITKRLTKPPKKPKRLRIPDLKGLKKSKSSRKGFIIRIKQGNIVVSKTTTALPEKRAINLMRRIVDTTLQASGEIVRKGKTKIIDVKKTVLGNKFRPKRSKDPKVRIQVEKRKFRLDTRGEIKGLRRSPRKRTKKSKRLKRLKRKK